MDGGKLAESHFRPRRRRDPSGSRGDAAGLTRPEHGYRGLIEARRDHPGRTAPLLPSLLLGVGLGGFIDGILLHQVLQWHHMLTAEGCCSAQSVVGLEDNTLADGFFHLLTWFVVIAGSLLAIRAWQRGRLAPPWRSHVGALLLGWGAFNVVEGLIDHQILGVHHVRDDLGGPIGWDLGFLAFGALLVVTGWAMVSSGRRARAATYAAGAPRSAADARP